MDPGVIVIIRGGNPRSKPPETVIPKLTCFCLCKVTSMLPYTESVKDQNNRVT